MKEEARMRAAFWAWVDEQGCDTDGAWSAWQGCWNLLHTCSVKVGCANCGKELAGANGHDCKPLGVALPDGGRAAPPSVGASNTESVVFKCDNPGGCRFPKQPCLASCSLTVNLAPTAGVTTCGNTPYDEGPFTLAENSEALVLAIREHLDGWASATFGWQGDPDPKIEARNRQAATQAHAAECLRRIRATLGVPEVQPQQGDKR